MTTISTSLRTYKDPSKEDQTRLFFALPSEEKAGEVGAGMGGEKMEINAVLTLQHQEDSFVRRPGGPRRCVEYSQTPFSRQESSTSFLHSFALYPWIANRFGLRYLYPPFVGSND